MIHYLVGLPNAINEIKSRISHQRHSWFTQKRWLHFQTLIHCRQIPGTRRYQNSVPQLTGNNVKTLMSLFEKRGSSVWNVVLGFLVFFGILIPFQIFKSNTVFYCRNGVKQSLNTKNKLELEIWDTANCFCFRSFFSSRYFRKVCF